MQKKATVNTELIIRHEKTLLIRTLNWYVANEEMSEPLLGRPVLDALGLNTKHILDAACDRLDGSVDENQIIDVDGEAAFVAQVRNEGMFFSAQAIIENSFKGEEDWLEF